MTGPEPRPLFPGAGLSRAAAARQLLVDCEGVAVAEKGDALMFPLMVARAVAAAFGGRDYRLVDHGFELPRRSLRRNTRR